MYISNGSETFTPPPTATFPAGQVAVPVSTVLGSNGMGELDTTT
jgi:hypothetical protein